MNYRAGDGVEELASMGTDWRPGVTNPYLAHQTASFLRF